MFGGPYLLYLDFSFLSLFHSGTSFLPFFVFSLFDVFIIANLLLFVNTFFKKFLIFLCIVNLCIFFLIVLIFIQFIPCFFLVLYNFSEYSKHYFPGKTVFTLILFSDKLKLQLYIVTVHLSMDILTPIKKGGKNMPINEKEYNGILFDQLSLLEEIEEVAKKENAQETLKLINKKRQQVERKLYQQPPLIGNCNAN